MTAPPPSLDIQREPSDIGVDEAGRLGAGRARLLEGAYAHRRAAVLTLALTGALFFRCSALGTYGFSDDEINKLQAIRAYERLDFTPNAEHPMLMKLAMYASVKGAHAWNDVARRTGATPIPLEAALRFPNALAGTLSTVIIFLLAEVMFGLSTAAWAAFLWAFDVNAIATNRIGKEDTFLVLFLFLAVWLYHRAKREGSRDPARARRWYWKSGAAFGLMAASKYMPYFYGLHALHVGLTDRRPGANRPRKLAFYAAMGGAFFAVNFAVVLPGTWRYLQSYAALDAVRHTGYYFAHHLYANMPGETPGGLPPWFYLAYLGTKAPIAILIAFLLGVGQMIRRRAESPFVFLRIFTVFFLLPYSFVASKFARYLLPFLFVMDIIAAVGIVWLLQQMKERHHRSRLAAMAGIGAVIVFSWSPMFAVVSSAPYYSFHQNAIGARLGPPGWMFPDDEFYDAGLREAVAYVAQAAAPHAVVSSEAPTVVREYLDRAGRSDVESWSLSKRGAPLRVADGWVLVQDGHTYFENADVLKTLRLRPPERVFTVDGVVAVEVFRNPR